MSFKKLLTVILSCIFIFTLFAFTACRGGDNSSGGNGSGGGSGNSSEATQTGYTVFYGSTELKNGSEISVEKGSESLIESLISVKVNYSDGSVKAAEAGSYSIGNNLKSEVSVGDEYTFIVSYGNFDSISFTVKIIEEITSDYTITITSGTENCYTEQVNSYGETTITFSNITEKTVCNFTGTLKGNIVVDVDENLKFELELDGATIVSDYNAPICELNSDKLTITAKKSSVNNITDRRTEVTDESSVSSAIYATDDLDIGGKGVLNVVSANNNGIHSKDDLEVKNLSLSVSCVDNALKGNDELSVLSGTITLIAKKGDGIKTSNTATKYNDDGTLKKQQGNVYIDNSKGDLYLTIYAACDGIDAAYDVLITKSTENALNIEIYTDKYSEYSEEVTDFSDGTLYLRYSSNSYSYSVMYYNSESDYVIKNAQYYTSTRGNRGGTYYYYKVDRPSGYQKIKVYAYSSESALGQTENYVFCSSYVALSSSYDTASISYYSGTASIDWTNFTTSSQGGPGGFPGGPGGGMQEGNTDKGDYSTKGIKADNEITITGGVITIVSYDDAIHANSDSELEATDSNGNAVSYGSGNITISGGELKLKSNDDAVHADGTLTVSGGSIDIDKCYEGLEGKKVIISGGDVSIISSDDGVNGTGSTDAESIVISGGTLYVYAGGDGIDSNSTSSYDGILISGGNSVIISNGVSDSAIDSERGYNYTGGRVLAVSLSGGMSSENTNCKNFSSVGTSSNLNLSEGNYLTATVSGKVVAAVKIPAGIRAMVVYLGSSSASLSQTSSFGEALNSDGVYFAD